MLTLACLPFLAPPAEAVEVEDLFLAEVLVASQSVDELRRGAAIGLERVLVRVSGRSDAARSELVRAALERPEDYYYEFSYGVSNDIGQVPGSSSNQLLRLLFDPNAITGLLREAGLPIWGKVRPQLLVWAVVEEAGERRLVTDNATDPVRRVLGTESRFRGLPVLYPLNDLQDQASVTPAIVWGGFVELVKVASARYPADVILVARLKRNRGGWHGRWSYLLDGDWQEFEFHSLGLSGLVGDSIGRLVDDLSSRYASASTQSSILVSVSSVNSLQDYADVLSYLSDLTPVVATAVTALKGQQVGVRLQIEGQVEQLMDVILLEKRLVLFDDLDDESTRTLHYEWQGLAR